MLSKEYRNRLRRHFYFRGHIFKYTGAFHNSRHGWNYQYRCLKCCAKIVASSREEYNIYGTYSYYNSIGTYIDTLRKVQFFGHMYRPATKWEYVYEYIHDSKLILCRNSQKGYKKFTDKENFKNLLL